MGKTKKEQLHPVLKHIEDAHITSEDEDDEEKEEHEVALELEYTDPPEIEDGPAGFVDYFYITSEQLPSNDHLKSIDLPKLVKNQNNSVAENSNLLLTYFSNNESYRKILKLTSKNSMKDFTIHIPFFEDEHIEAMKQGKDLVATDLPSTDMLIKNPRIYAVDFGSLTSQKRKEPSQIRIEVSYQTIQIEDAILKL